MLGELTKHLLGECRHKTVWRVNTKTCVQCESMNKIKSIKNSIKFGQCKNKCMESELCVESVSMKKMISCEDFEPYMCLESVNQITVLRVNPETCGGCKNE